MRASLFGLLLLFACSAPAMSSTEVGLAPFEPVGSSSSGSVRHPTNPSSSSSSGAIFVDGGTPACPPDAANAPVDATASHPVQVLATGLSKPSALAIDLTNVYWLDELGGLFKVPKTGGSPVMLFNGGGNIGQVPSIGLDATSVYFSAFYQNQYVVAATPITGGDPANPRVLATEAANGVAVALGNVYWIDGTNQGRRISTNGGAVEPIKTPTSAFNPDGGFFTTVGPDAVYTSFLFNPTIVRFPFDGSPAQQYQPSTDTIRGVVADADTIYFASDRTLSSLPKTGAACPTALVTNLFNPYAVAADATAIYMTDQAGSVISVPKNGGQSQLLAKNQVTPTGLAVDATTVFWTNRDDGTLNSVAK